MNPLYFDKKDGLRAYTVARAVMDISPTRWGVDRTFWVYDEGVWSSNDDAVHRRICRVLGEDYRTGYGQIIRDVMRAELPRMDVDPVPKYINMKNKMVEWQAAVVPEAVRHEPAFLSTVQLPVEWRRGSTCPDFDKFLDWALAPEDVPRVWEIIGYLMMPGNPLQRAVLLVGGGGNGKGVLLHVIKELLGERNCTSVPLHDFAENRFATAELFGRLANICGDIDATFLENTSRIKEITGEDTVMGERKGQDPFYFKPWCKLVFSANAIPGSADASVGFTRRFEVVEFPNTPEFPDLKLKDKLTTRASLQGIAQKGVDALRRLMENRQFSDGDARRRANRELAERSNSVLRWLYDRCDYPIPHEVAFTPTSEAWRAFQPWSWSEGVEVKKQGFYQRLRNAPGVKFVTNKGTQGFRGFALKDATQSPPESKSTPVQMALDQQE